MRRVRSCKARPGTVVLVFLAVDQVVRDAIEDRRDQG
jgi:hypothetical protein